MIIALKGYIGSGKTTIANYLAKNHNFEIINADAIVKHLYATDDDLKKQIVTVLALSTFDTKIISEIVFSNPEKLKQLEAVVHPILTREIKEQINKSSQDIIIDCQVIDKLPIIYDYEILLTASLQTIIERVQQRDNKDEQLIRNIIITQEKFLKQKVKVFPLNTEKTEEEVQKDLTKILKIFTKEQEYKKYEEEFDEEDW
ncbi:MAG: dephospho-CoA kinase [Mycoplasmatales bacterium]